MGVDFVKMIEQEPDFKAYCERAALAMIMANKKDRGGVLGTMYSFYTMGMSDKQLSEFFENVNKFGNGQGADND